MKEIIIASGNKGKIRETQEILNEYKIISMNELGIDIDVEEDKNTFEGNAIKKAQTIAKKIGGKMCIADDSGIEIYDLMCHYRDHSGIFDLSDFSTDDYPDVYRRFRFDRYCRTWDAPDSFVFPFSRFPDGILEFFPVDRDGRKSDFPVFNPPIDLFIALSSYPAALLGYRRRLGKYSGSGFYRFDYNRVDVGLAIEEIQDRGIE